MTDLVFILADHPQEGETMFVRRAGRQGAFGGKTEQDRVAESDSELAERVLKQFREGMQGKLGYEPVGMDIMWTCPHGAFTAPDIKPLSHYVDSEDDSGPPKEQGDPCIPCPRCGSTMTVCHHKELQRYTHSVCWVGCVDCGIRTRNHDDRKQAIEDWNKTEWGGEEEDDN